MTPLQLRASVSSHLLPRMLQNQYTFDFALVLVSLVLAQDKSPEVSWGSINTDTQKVLCRKAGSSLTHFVPQKPDHDRVGRMWQYQCLELRH